MANPRYKSFLGIAKETTRSAGVAPTPVAATDYIPIKNLSPFDEIKYLDDNNWRGSMVETYGTVEGPVSSTFSFEGDVFPDTIGYPLAGVLGDYAVTGASAPYTHTIAVKNSGTGQATSYTLTDYNSYDARQFAGIQFGEISFKFSADGLLEYNCAGTGYASAIASTPTPSFSNIVNIPVWVGTTTIAGSPALNVQSGDINIKRPLSPIFTVDGSQNPYQVWQGAVSVEGSLTFVMENNTELNYYLNNSQPSLVINFTQGSGATLTSVQFTMTKAAFKVAKVTRSKDYVEVEANFTAIANSTDVGASAGYSPIKVVLQNAKSTAVYA